MPVTNAPATSVPDRDSQRRSNRRKRRVRRLRDEAGLYLLRGAATAAGTAVMTYSTLWLKTHL
jgi:hypothetical protein